MNKQQFIQWAQSHGWHLDRWGHLQNTTGTKRFKLSSIAVRYEVKSAAGWVRLASNYYSKLTVGEDGKLKGL